MQKKNYIVFMKFVQIISEIYYNEEIGSNGNS